MEIYNMNEEVLELFIRQVCINRLDTHKEDIDNVISEAATMDLLGASEEEIKAFITKEIEKILWEGKR